MSSFEQLERLVATFEEDVRLANELQSPNPDDDLPTKVAIVGFSYNSPTEEWDLGHFEFLKKLRAREYPNNELAEYGEHAENVVLFFALGIGYLLGLHHQKMIGDDDFEVAESQLSGLIMFHLGNLTARRLT
jgi:hypothetical protein